MPENPYKSPEAEGKRRYSPVWLLGLAAIFFIASFVFYICTPVPSHTPTRLEILQARACMVLGGVSLVGGVCCIELFIRRRRAARQAPRPN